MPTIYLPKKVGIDELTDILKTAASEIGFTYHNESGSAYVSMDLCQSIKTKEKEVSIPTGNKLYINLIGMKKEGDNSEIQCFGEVQINVSEDRLNMPHCVNLGRGYRYRGYYDRFANAVIKHLKPPEPSPGASGLVESE